MAFLTCPLVNFTRVLFFKKSLLIYHFAHTEFFSALKHKGLWWQSSSEPRGGRKHNWFQYLLIGLWKKKGRGVKAVFQLVSSEKNTDLLVRKNMRILGKETKIKEKKLIHFLRTIRLYTLSIMVTACFIFSLWVYGCVYVWICESRQ